MKTTKKILSVVIVGVSLFSAQYSVAGLLYNYSQLALKDLDQVNAMVLSKIRESKKSSSGKTVPLMEALQAVYSRPNEDGMIEKVVSPLRTELDELDAWDQALNDLVVEAIDALKNPGAFKPVVQVTYQLFLENLLADMKPFLNKDGFERGLAEKIRDGKLEVTREASSERRLRMMKSTISPSQIASQMLVNVKVATEAPAAEKSDITSPDDHKSPKADKKRSKKAPKIEAKEKDMEPPVASPSPEEMKDPQEYM